MTTATDKISRLTALFPKVDIATLTRHPQDGPCSYGGFTARLRTVLQFRKLEVATADGWMLVAADHDNRYEGIGSLVGLPLDEEVLMPTFTQDEQRGIAALLGRNPIQGRSIRIGREIFATIRWSDGRFIAEAEAQSPIFYSDFNEVKANFAFGADVWSDLMAAAGR